MNEESINFLQFLGSRLTSCTCKQTNKQTRGSLNIPHSILHDSKFRRSQNIHNDDDRNCKRFRSGTFRPVSHTRFTTTRAQSTELGLTPHGLSSLQSRQQNSHNKLHTNRAKLKTCRCHRGQKNFCSSYPPN